MVHFLRSNNDKTIAEIEVYINRTHKRVEVSSEINIREYSGMLLKRSILGGAENLVDDFEKINNFQATLSFDHIKPLEGLTESDVNQRVRDFLNEVADRYNLKYVKD